MKKAILFGLVFGLFYSCAQKQEEAQTLYRIVEVEIIGDKIYDDLYVRSVQLDGNTMLFAGKTDNGSQWIFAIPDSIIQETECFELVSRDSISIYASALFRTAFLIENDTLKAVQFNFAENEMNIRLKKEFSHIVHEDGNPITFLDFSIVMRIRENFEDYLEEFASRIEKNPTSLLYMRELASTVGFYTSREDVERLYNLFCVEVQRSFFGQVVYANFGALRINNISLMNTETEREEKIITSSDKYTLVIFSASWCRPCIMSIPKMKEIHEKIGEFLEMVYITLDDERTLPNWIRLMRNENIAWRSLVYGRNRELPTAWGVIGIPGYVLVSPNLEIRRIILRNENDVNNLYSIVRHKNEK